MVLIVLMVRIVLVRTVLVVRIVLAVRVIVLVRSVLARVIVLVMGILLVDCACQSTSNHEPWLLAIDRSPPATGPSVNARNATHHLRIPLSSAALHA